MDKVDSIKKGSILRLFTAWLQISFVFNG